MKRKARKDNDIMPEKRGFKCKYWTARQDKTMSTVTVIFKIYGKVMFWHFKEETRMKSLIEKKKSCFTKFYSTR
jgi:hypothetical protein